MFNHIERVRISSWELYREKFEKEILSEEFLCFHESKRKIIKSNIVQGMLSKGDRESFFKENTSMRKILKWALN